MFNDNSVRLLIFSFVYSSPAYLPVAIKTELNEPADGPPQQAPLGSEVPPTPDSVVTDIATENGPDLALEEDQTHSLEARRLRRTRPYRTRRNYRDHAEHRGHGRYPTQQPGRGIQPAAPGHGPRRTKPVRSLCTASNSRKNTEANILTVRTCSDRAPQADSRQVTESCSVSSEIYAFPS